jgi:hypothetical protein
MISRADAGRDQGNPASGRDHAPSRLRNRSGPVAGSGLSLRLPRLARLLPGRRPAQFSDARSRPMPVIVVEQCGAADDQSAVAGLIW